MDSRREDEFPVMIFSAQCNISEMWEKMAATI